MRTKKAIYNSITALLLQVVTAVVGLILPSLMIRTYGSEANGAVSSISQFLGYISLIEAGAGGVARAALYGPLAKKDTEKISGIINATERFFRKIAGIFVVYAIVIACIYPYITKSNLDWIYTFILVLIIALSTFAQYYFGITYSVLLNADQCAYFTNSIQILTLVVNTIISIILVEIGCSLHIVKLFSAFVYVLKPIVLKIIVTRKYQLSKKTIPDNAAIKARWNGLGHHIAYFLHNNTDIFLISVFLGLKYVSVYAIYYMITSSIKNIVTSLTGGVEAALGNMIAKKEDEILDKNFRIIEIVSSIFSVALFGTTLVLIFDFISVYMSGVSDIQYIIPAFGILIVVSEMLHCIKSPYHGLVLAAGHYKETQFGAFVEAGLNIGISIIALFIWGLPGVVLGTIIATIFRIINYIFYLRKNIIKRKVWVFAKRQIINVINFITILAICYILPFSSPLNYVEWFFNAVIVVILAFSLTFVLNYIFYKKEVQGFIKKVLSLFKRNK